MLKRARGGESREYGKHNAPYKLERICNIKFRGNDYVISAAESSTLLKLPLNI